MSRPCARRPPRRGPLGLAYDQTVQGVFANIAAKISPSGRQALANWPPGRKPVAAKQ